jgi:hypothetical protein
VHPACPRRCQGRARAKSGASWASPTSTTDGVTAGHSPRATPQVQPSPFWKRCMGMMPLARFKGCFINNRRGRVLFRWDFRILSSRKQSSTSQEDSSALVCNTPRRRPTLTQEGFPGAPQRPLNPLRRGDQDIDVCRLNLLHGTEVQISHFCQLLLGHSPLHPFTAHSRAEPLEGSLIRLGQRHPLYQAPKENCGTPQWGVKMLDGHNPEYYNGSPKLAPEDRPLPKPRNLPPCKPAPQSFTSFRPLSLSY